MEKQLHVEPTMVPVVTMYQQWFLNLLKNTTMKL